MALRVGAAHFALAIAGLASAAAAQTTPDRNAAAPQTAPDRNAAAAQTARDNHNSVHGADVVDARVRVLAQPVETVEPIRVDFAGVPECGDGVNFMRDVMTRTARVRAARANELARVLKVSIAHGRPGETIGELSVLRAGDRTPVRLVVAGTCDDVLAMLAQFGALSLDPAVAFAPTQEALPDNPYVHWRGPVGASLPGNPYRNWAGPVVVRPDNSYRGAPGPAQTIDAAPRSTSGAETLPENPYRHAVAETLPDNPYRPGR